MYDYKGESLDEGNGGRAPPGPGNPPETPSPPVIRTAATLGPPIPLLWGTDKFRGTAIYAGAIRYSDGTYWVRTWDASAGVWKFERTDTVPAVIGICEAPVTAIKAVWRDGLNRGSLPAPEDILVGYEGGNPTASEWALTTTPTSPSFLTYSAVGSAWQGIAQFRSQFLVAPSRKIPAVEVEASSAPAGYSLIGDDAQAPGVIKEMLTSVTRGLGIKGADGTADTVVEILTGLDGRATSSVTNYCSASGFRVSRAVMEQTPTRELLADLLDAINCTIVRSGDRLKIVPLGEDALGSGTYVPAATGVLIDDNELLHERNRDTVTVTIKPEERVYNTFPITIKDRLYSYRENTFEYIEPAHAAEHGVRRAPRRYMPWIKTAAHALKISALLARRSITIRRTFRFRLSPRWIALEPGDIIALTHARLGLSAEPVRIVAIEEDARGAREIWADEWPAGLSKIVDLTPETQDGLSSVAPNPYLTAAGAEYEVLQLGTLVNTKARTYQQSAAPAGPNTTGDLWFDSDDGNKPYRWDGAAWVSAQDGSIALVGGGVTTYVQAAAPTGDLVAGDLWFESDAGNKMYRWSGSAWVVVQDAGAAAGSAANKTYIQTTAPTGGTYVAGDLWFDSDDGNKPYRWSGSAWFAIQDASIATKVPAGGAAADVNANGTTVNGAKITDQTLGGGKLKCVMATLTVVNPSIFTAGIGVQATSYRLSMNGSYGVRMYPLTAMSGNDFVIAVQGLGASGAAVYYLPKVVSRTSTYFDIMFQDPATFTWVDPLAMAGTSYWMVLALDT